MASKNPAFVMFKKEGIGVRVSWRFSTRISVSEEGVLDCSIPEFEIFFNAKDRGEVDRKSRGFMRMFISYYLHDKNGIRNLSSQLIRLGFRSTHGVADIAKLSRNKAHPTKFSSPRIEVKPDTEQVELEDQLVA